VKAEIHPQWYPEARVTCACGNTWTTGSTRPEIRTDLCSACHPFYTGEQRIVDTEGQVDRFLKRLKAREGRLTAEGAAEQATALADIPVSTLELGTRYEKALAEAGVTTAADIVERFEAGGDQALLDIKGFGAKGLIDIKRKLRSQGVELPEV
jgi:large subunit ribosomal protein L31